MLMAVVERGEDIEELATVRWSWIAPLRRRGTKGMLIDMEDEPRGRTGITKVEAEG